LSPAPSSTSPLPLGCNEHRHTVPRDHFKLQQRKEQTTVEHTASLDCKDQLNLSIQQFFSRRRFFPDVNQVENESKVFYYCNFFFTQFHISAALDLKHL
jgi:hypothetical protein